MMEYKYKDSKHDLFGKIPEHWQVKRLAPLGKFDKGVGIPKSSLSENGLPVILYGDIYTKYNFQTQIALRNIPEIVAAISKSIDKGTILFAASGETKEEIGKNIAYIGDKKVFIGGDIITFKPSKTDSIFLSFALESVTSIYQKSIFSKGDIVVHIYPSKLRDLKICLPPLPEQQAIAGYLDKACTRIDRIIEIKEKQLKRIEFALKRKIDEIVLQGLEDFNKKRTRADFIGDIPEHYRLHKLKHITHQITDGAHHTPNYLDKKYEDSIPFLRVTDLHKSKINLENAKYISKEEHSELIKRCKPEKNDLLLSKNGTIGVTKIVDWDYEFSVFVSVAVIKPDSKHLDTEYLNYYFKSEIMDYQMQQGSKQITVTNLHLDKIREFFIVTPPVNEQKILVKRMKEAERLMIGTTTNIKSQIKTLKNYRKSLIHECVTGKKQIFFDELNVTENVYAGE